VVSVTTEPGDQGAADATIRGYLRAAHTDREHVIHMLKAAFVQCSRRGQLPLQPAHVLAAGEPRQALAA
jgi:hypothetical protein